MSYQKLFEQGISCEPAKAWKAAGKKVLGTYCRHIPEEILRAADVLPIRMRATGCGESPDAESWMSPRSCSFARGILQYWLDGTYDLDGMIVTDGCLQPTRAFDNAEHIGKKTNSGRYFQQIGAPRKYSPMTVKYYKEEMYDLIEGLEKLTGNKVTDENLIKYIDLYNEERRLVREVMELRKADEPVITGAQALNITLKACDYPVEEYNEMLKEFLADVDNMEPIKGKRARLMIIGSALDDPDYIKIIEDKGGIVVADALCYQSMGFTGTCEVDKNDIVGSLADFYNKRLVCPRMMDNRDQLHDYVVDCCREYRIDGVIYEKMQYCECCGGESLHLEQRLKEIDVPVLNIDREEKLANAGQLAIRAEAFIEMVEKED